MRAVLLLMLSPFMTGVLSESQADSDCGALGKMAVDLSTLPSHVSPEHIRACLDHPVGKLLEQKRTDQLDKRGCWQGNPSGCTRGYCWKTCGPTGQWCWTAYNGGFGDWIKCSNDGGCNTGMACGEGGCKDCGCSCH